MSETHEYAVPEGQQLHNVWCHWCMVATFDDTGRCRRCNTERGSMPATGRTHRAYEGPWGWTGRLYGVAFLVYGPDPDPDMRRNPPSRRRLQLQRGLSAQWDEVCAQLDRDRVREMNEAALHAACAEAGRYLERCGVDIPGLARRGQLDRWLASSGLRKEFGDTIGAELTWLARHAVEATLSSWAREPFIGGCLAVHVDFEATDTLELVLHREPDLHEHGLCRETEIARGRVV